LTVQTKQQNFNILYILIDAHSDGAWLPSCQKINSLYSPGTFPVSPSCRFMQVVYRHDTRLFLF